MSIQPKDSTIEIEKKTKIFLFDPIAHCEINLKKENDSLILRREKGKRKLSSLQRDVEDHGSIDFVNLKSIMKLLTDKNSLTINPAVPHILSFALQKYMKNIIQKIYLNSQIRTDLPLSDPSLKNVIKITTKPGLFLKQVHDREETEKNAFVKIMELELLQIEANALQKNQISTKKDNQKLEELDLEQKRSKQIIQSEINAARGLSFEELNVKPIKWRKVNSNNIQNLETATISMTDVISFLENDKK